MAGCAPKVRRGGRVASPLARQVWRAAHEDYARQLNYPWLTVRTTADELANWVGNVVNRNRLPAEPRSAPPPGRTKGTRRTHNAVPATVLQQLLVVVMGERNDADVAAGLIALADASTSASESLQPLMAWAASQLARSNVSATSLQLFMNLTAPARASARAAAAEANRYEGLYETAAAEARHFKSRTQDLSRELQTGIEEKRQADAAAAQAVRDAEAANASLEALKKQAADTLRVEQDRLKADISRTIGHEITEALLSLDGEDPSVEMALDRLRRAQRTLDNITQDDQ